MHIHAGEDGLAQLSVLLSSYWLVPQATSRGAFILTDLRLQNSSKS